MAFGIGDGLNVRVSANTQSFESGMEGAQDSLNSVRNAAGTTSGSLQVLQGRADETGDELRRVDRQADDARRSFTLLTASTNGLSLSMGSFSSVLAATTIPALITLSTVAAPLVVVFGGIAAAAGSLAAVFGGLAATGVVTHMDELQSALQTAKEEILEIIQPLGEVFGPLLVDAVEALPDLVQAIVDSLGPMDQFRQTLINFGNTAMRLIPDITAGMFDLAEAALPALNQALTALESQGPGIFEDLQSVFNEVYPLVVSLGSAIAGILPDILDLGTTVANLLLPALEGMISTLDRVISRVNNLQPSAQRLVVSAVALAPILSTLASLLGGMSAPILAVVAAVGALAVAFKNDFGGIRTRVEELLPTMEEIEEVATDAFETLESVVSDAVEFFTPLFEELGGLVREIEGLGRTMTTSLEPSFNAMSNTLSGSTSDFKAFATTARNLLTGFVNFLETIVIPAVEFLFETVIAPLVNQVVKSLSKQLGPVLDEVGQTLQVIGNRGQTAGNALINAWEKVDHIVVPIIETSVELTKEIADVIIDTLANSLKFFMNLVQGDFGEAMGNLEDQLSAVSDFTFDIIDILVDGINAAIAWIKEDGAELIADFTTDVATAILDFQIGFAQFLIGAIEDGINATIDWIKEAPGVIADFTTEVASSILDFQIGFAEFLIGSIKGGINAAIDWIAETPDLIMDLADDLADALGNIGAGIGDAIVNGINDAIPNEVAFEVGEIVVAGQTVYEGGSVDLDLPDNPVPSAQTGGFVDQSGLLMAHQGERVVPASQVTDRGKVEVSGGGPSEVKVVVEGDTDVIREVSTEVVEDQNRRTRRNSGTTTSITR